MRINKYIKLGILILSGLTLVAAPVQAQEVASQTGFNPQELLRNTLQWVNDLGAIAPLVFILIYIIATVAFLPGSVLTLGAGVLFGVIKGSVYVFIGATLGATLAFLVGRYLARGWISKKIQGDRSSCGQRRIKNCSFNPFISYISL
jgi:uncharacterized membrane protein YdjX (TVP38/TMEM64 family)